MSKHIRTLVAIASVPLLLSVATAHAAKPGSGTVPPSYDFYTATGGCEMPLMDLEAAVNSMYGAAPSAKQQYIIDGLVSKVWGADQKVDQIKYLEALGLLTQIDDKLDLLVVTDKLGVPVATYIKGYVSTSRSCVVALQCSVENICP